MYISVAHEQKMEVTDQGAQFFSWFSEVKGDREIMSGDITQGNT